MDIAEFVKARLDEDEAIARDAADADGTWLIRGNISPQASSTVVTARGDFLTASPAEALHVAEHSPARVLREVEAKRAIAALHGPDPAGINCDTCHHQYPCATLLHIAAIWAGHPDYDEAWRP